MNESIICRISSTVSFPHINIHLGAGPISIFDSVLLLRATARVGGV